MRLHVVIASTRPGRKGPLVADWFAGEAAKAGSFEVETVDLATFDLPIFDEPAHPALGRYEHDHTKGWSAKVAEADAFAFVLPEYDFFPPASLVNALQYLVKEWQYKPVAFVSYGGISGGLRSAQALKLLVTALKMMPIPEGVVLPAFSQQVGEAGTFVPTKANDEAAKLVVGELARWAEALATMR